MGRPREHTTPGHDPPPVLDGFCGRLREHLKKEQTKPKTRPPMPPPDAASALLSAVQDDDADALCRAAADGPLQHGDAAWSRVAVTVVDPPTGTTVLHAAAAYGGRCLRLLLSAPDAASVVDVADARDQTPLHVAAFTPSPSGVAALLDAGAAVERWDRHATQPLHTAILDFSLQCHRGCAVEGDDDTAAGRLLASVLRWVLRAAATAEVVRLLVAHGADPARATDSGATESPLYLATALAAEFPVGLPLLYTLLAADPPVPAEAVLRRARRTGVSALDVAGAAATPSGQLAYAALRERLARAGTLAGDDEDGDDCAVCGESLLWPARLACGHVLCLPCTRLALDPATGVCPFRCARATDVARLDEAVPAGGARRVAVHTHRAVDRLVRELGPGTGLDLLGNLFLGVPWPDGDMVLHVTTSAVDTGVVLSVTTAVARGTDAELAARAWGVLCFAGRHRDAAFGVCRFFGADMVPCPGEAPEEGGDGAFCTAVLVQTMVRLEAPQPGALLRAVCLCAHRAAWSDAAPPPEACVPAPHFGGPARAAAIAAAGDGWECEYDAATDTLCVTAEVLRGLPADAEGRARLATALLGRNCEFSVGADEARDRVVCWWRIPVGDSRRSVLADGRAAFAAAVAAYRDAAG